MHGRSESLQRANLEALLSAVKDNFTPTASSRSGAPATARGNEQLLSSSDTREEPVCGDPNCTGGWALPWKSRRHILFEGRSGCRPRCLRAIVHSAILREGGDTRGSIAAAPHRHRVPLGLVMLAQGWITHPQLQRALEVQRANGAGRIGDWLIAECGLPAATVTRGLSVQWSCPVLSTDNFSPAAMALVVPRLFVAEYGLLPLRVAGSRILYLGFQDHLDASAGFAAERMTELRIESGMVEQGEFRAARHRLLSAEFPAASFSNVPDRDRLTSEIVALLEQEQPAHAKLVRLHRHYWLRMLNTSVATPRSGILPSSVDQVTDHIFTIGAEA